MESTALALALLLPFSAWFCFLFLIHGFAHRKSFKAPLPPGPRRLPIIGNLLDLGEIPHQSLAALSKTYGPVMSLELGTTTTIVVSSPEAAQEVLSKKDQALSGRMDLKAVQIQDHHKFSVVFLPSTPHWRSLRKICSMQIFSPQRLDASQGLRRKVVQQLLDYGGECCSSGRAIDIGKAAFTTSLNLLSNTFFSVDLTPHESGLSQELMDVIWNIMVETGKPNLADFFPGLRWMDPHGIQKRLGAYFSKVAGLVAGFVNQRLESKASSADGDVLDCLLNLNKKHDHQLSPNDIIHLLVDLINAGTDTTSSTIEWAMAELLNNPKAMGKAQAELREVVGKDKIVEEADISKLPYLRAVVKETLRLHPPVPCLIPRKAAMDTEISGYAVPKNAQVLVNVWAISRDSRIWSNPDSFDPKRFLESEIDVKGQNFELLPFGAGRRICAGLLLGHKMVHLVLASLLHSFDWKLEDGMQHEDMDMREKIGFTLRKAQALSAIPSKP